VIGNTAGVSTGKSNESILSPVGSPRVLDDPGSIVLVSNQEHSVVKSFRAVAEHSGLVQGPVAGVDTDRNGLTSYCRLQRSGVSSSQNLVSRIGQNLGSRRVIAASYSSSVWVSALSVDSISTDEIQSPLRPSSIAALALVSLSTAAIHELLLRVAGHISMLESPGTFQSSSGRERPARAAASLILDGAHNSLTPPVNTIWNGSSNRDSFSVNIRQAFHEDLADELIGGHVSELSDSHLIGVGRVSIVLLNLLEVLIKDGSSELFLVGNIGFAIASLEALKVVAAFVSMEDKGSGD